MGGTLVVDADSAAILLLQPLLLAHWYSAPPPGRVTPLRIGDGWAAAELGAPGDAELFALLLETESFTDAEELSAAAQQWRLPVVPYRRARRAQDQSPHRPGIQEPFGRDDAARRSGQSSPAARAALAGLNVVDVTAMWAGPLCTWLLAQLGASVVVVESDARPDGMRAPHGGGIYPGGRLERGAKDRSAMFTSLAAGKARVNLDLRLERDRAAFDLACAHADLRVDSLSRRARANLGITDPSRFDDGPAIVHISAFSRGPSRDWAAYGTQVHAMSGLAWPAGADEPIPAATAYVDGLGGIAAALASVVALHSAAQQGPDPTLTASLMDAVDALPADRDRGALLRADPMPRVAELAEAHNGRTVHMSVAGASLRHPGSPFMST
ncbi:CoA transferase [Microbacterium sp.]|uniref:CoA transferase n=1 Tax=Microbacterium sp. TaxID=51671 RepID=UPI0025E25FC4|nr:CoA transferase [Microbacterium sp.]